jgi:thymidylate synthase (FAD)
MLVQLLTSTPDPEQVVAAAARLCYSDASIAELLGQEPEQAGRLLDKIMDLGHFSVLEHASFSFGIEGISRSCSHQLVRHRIASFSQQSQRYVSHDQFFSVVTPATIAEDQDLLARFNNHMQGTHELYRDLINAGVPAEDARFVLPNAAATKLVMTMNARELHHFFRLRCCRRSQWEIRAMAREMLRLARQAAPRLFTRAGPGCLHAPCPEGSMTCGAIREVREEYAKL